MTVKHTNDYYSNHPSHFGGILYVSDFDTVHSGSRNMASRIAADWRFDEHCRKNEEVRNLRAKEDVE